MCSGLLAGVIVRSWAKCLMVNVTVLIISWRLFANPSCGYPKLMGLFKCYLAVE